MGLGYRCPAGLTKNDILASGAIGLAAPHGAGMARFLDGAVKATVMDQGQDSGIEKRPHLSRADALDREIRHVGFAGARDHQ